MANAALFWRSFTSLHSFVKLVFKVTADYTLGLLKNSVIFLFDTGKSTSLLLVFLSPVPLAMMTNLGSIFGQSFGMANGENIVYVWAASIFLEILSCQTFLDCYYHLINFYFSLGLALRNWAFDISGHTFLHIGKSKSPLPDFPPTLPSSNFCPLEMMKKCAVRFLDGFQDFGLLGSISDPWAVGVFVLRTWVRWVH